MKSPSLIPLLILVVILGAGLRPTWAQGGADREARGDSPIKPAVMGFLDRDRDGVNDLFRDADGDGVNDATKRPYPHRFAFRDADKDGINDLFMDRDGDGVNDRGVRFRDEDGDGINDNVLDHDRDGANDITGLRYRRDRLMGYRYGCVDEERGATARQFRDEDGDGMDDFLQRGRVRGGRGDGHDYFIDEDGDGICDGRGFRRGGGPTNRTFRPIGRASATPTGGAKAATNSTPGAMPRSGSTGRPTTVHAEAVGGITLTLRYLYLDSRSNDAYYDYRNHVLSIGLSVGP